MDDAPRTIGRYQVLDCIGQGGMGVLYLALDPAIGRLVALKVLRVQGEEMRKRFEREARMIGRFQHPNIVTVYDVGLHEGQPFIAMEHIPGETLAEKILRQEPLHLSRRLEFIEELCDGLAYAHQRGVVHRDVKPANLIVHRESGRLKILDFGIARPTVKDTGITQLGTRLGTPRYMAPEQVQGFPVDQRTDVFAVGLVLYEALAYEPAFPGDEGQLVAYRITHESPLALTRVESPLDPELISVVDRAIEKVAARRYQDLQAMRADLVKIRERLDAYQLDSTVTTVITQEPTVSTAPTTPRQIDRGEVLRRREAQLQGYLVAAQEAVGRGAFEQALEAGEQAVLLSPDDPRVRELLDRLHTAQENHQVGEWLTAARQKLGSGALTRALDLVGQALQLRPDNAEAGALRDEVQRAQAAREDVRERAETVIRSLEHSRQSLEAGAFESALRGASEVLVYEPQHSEANALKQRALQELEDRQQRRAARDQQARDAVDAAREEFAAGQQEQALRRLEGFPGEHPLVTDALVQLRATREAPRAAEPGVMARQPVPLAATQVSPVTQTVPILPASSPHVSLWARVRSSGAAQVGLVLVAATVIVGWAVVANRPSLDDVPPAEGVTGAPVEVQAPPPGAAPAPPPVPAAPAPPPAIAAEPGAGTAQPEPVAESATQEVGARGEPEVAEIQAQLINLFDRADQAVGDARYAEAAAAYQSILRLDPGNTDARDGLATANGLGRQRALRQIGEFLAQAQAAFERGDLEAALNRYEDVLDIDPGHRAAGEGVRAITTAEEIASGSRQRRLDDLVEAAQVAFEEGDLVGARQAYEEVLRIDSSHRLASDGLQALTTAEEIASGGRQRRIDELLETALAAFNRGDLAAARNGYEEVLALDPTPAGASEGLEAVTAAEEIVGIRRNPRD